MVRGGSMGFGVLGIMPDLGMDSWGKEDGDQYGCQCSERDRTSRRIRKGEASRGGAVMVARKGE